MKLALRYETFLNCIYSLFESLSNIVRCLDNDVKLKYGFYKQKNQIIKKMRDVDIEYTKILELTDWYDEIHSIRSESTHFLSGFITIDTSGAPGYFNKPMSVRNGSTPQISKDNIRQHIDEIYGNVDRFLERFGDHFIKKIDPDIRIAHICLLIDGGYLGCRSQSLNDIFHKLPGICITRNVNCPFKNSCGAYKNAIESETKNNID